MARITRVTAVPFGAAGTTDDFETFGSTAGGAADFSKDIAAIQATSAWSNGWRDALIAAKAPVLQDMNGKMLVDSNLICYLFQEGVPEYDSGTTYYKGGVVKNLARAGYIEFYASLTDGNSANALPARVSDSHWLFLYAINTTAQGLIIPGVVTVSAAAAGDVGEYLEQQASTVPISVSNTMTNIASIPLTAGDWDLTGMAFFDVGSAATLIKFALALSAFSGNTRTDEVQGLNYGQTNFTAGDVQDQALSIPRWRVNISAPATYYVKGMAVMSSGSVNAWGSITARRMR